MAEIEGPLRGERVAVAMSGGVDSSVAALLLIESGYEVIGLTMKLWSCLELSLARSVGRICCSPDHIAGVRTMADRYLFPYHLIDFERQFEEIVIKPFVFSYLKAETPNPCILCNEKMKFALLLAEARRLGCRYLATGHYTRIKTENGRFFLAPPKDRAKDQSYFLFSLNQDVLGRCLFPLADYSKDEVKRIAFEKKLPALIHRESQDICFLPGGDYPALIERRRGGAVGQGDIVDCSNNKILGKHRGYYHYTIGQRRGLSLAMGEPYYVVGIDHRRNIVRVGPISALYHDRFETGEIHFMKEERFSDKTYLARLRYTAKPATCKVNYDYDAKRAIVTFEEKQRGITPGQAVVFYDLELGLVAGGWIERVS